MASFINSRIVDSESINNAEIIVVGAGFYGLTIANLVAEKLGKKVLIIEKRAQIGGNAYAYIDEASGIEVHKYGTHLFHTSNKKVWDYVNLFSEFTNYQHTVFTRHRGQLYSMPINLNTINKIFGENFNPIEAQRAVEKDIRERNTTSNLGSFETKALSTIGPRLYEALILGYTKKQWQIDPKLLPESVFSRLPVRFNLTSNYFTDSYQGLPGNGYGDLFKKMIESSKISIFCSTDFFTLKSMMELQNKVIVYTGPIDRYFDYKFGRLNWRTLDFEIDTLDIADFQGTSVINEADEEIAFTRTHEFKHLHPEWKYAESKTVIMREFSRFANEFDEPYYPVNTIEDRAKLVQYREAVEKEKNTYFGGRLGTYQYLDMHMAIASAHNLFETHLIKKLA